MIQTNTVRILFCTLLSFLFFPATSISLSAQEKVTCHLGTSIYQRDLIPVLGLNPAEAIITVNEILSKDHKSGALIRIQAANVSNAEVCFATGEDRPFRILFSPDFFAEIYKDTPEVWANRAILAHEVGHIVNNDFINGDFGSTPAVELRADQYAGKILAKMGADLNQALSAYRSKRMQQFRDSDNYPKPEDRVEAVKLGWTIEKSVTLTPTSETESNVSELKKRFEDLGKAGYKLKPSSFDLLGMKCSLTGVEVTKSEASNRYGCQSVGFSPEERRKYSDKLFNIINVALDGTGVQSNGNSDSAFFQLPASTSKLKRLNTTYSVGEPQYTFFEFLLTWNSNQNRPYFSTTPSQAMLDFGKEIEQKLSDLESTNIANTKNSFVLGELACSSDYNGVETEETDHSNPIRVNFECYSTSYAALNTRKQKLRDLFDSVEYALRAKDYKWEYNQGSINSSSSARESVYFRMPSNPTKNRLDNVYVMEESNNEKLTGRIRVTFTVLK